MNQWDLIRPLGIGDPSPETDPTEMPVSPGAAESLASRLRDRGVDAASRRVIVVHVSAGNAFRRWPAARFADLLARLARADPRRWIVVTSGPSDREAAREVGSRARALAGGGAAIADDFEVDLAELRALVEVSALFIGGDSGPLHVAGTSAVPVVGLYGPTLPLRSAPWRPSRFVTESIEIAGLPCRPCDQRVCQPGDFRCLVELAPERVAAAAERALQRAAVEQG